MPLQVNYDDDFFYLSTLIKALDWAIELKLDPEFFAAKVNDDVKFLDTTLEKLGTSLDEHGMVHGRMTYLRALFRTERLFVECLGTMTRSETEFISALGSFETDFGELLARHRQLLSVIQESLDTMREEQPVEEAISEAEYRVLFDPETEEIED